MRKGKVKSAFCVMLAVFLGTLGIASVMKRTQQCDGFTDDLTLAAAAFVMPEAGVRNSRPIITPT